MTNPIFEQINHAMEDLAKQRERLHEAQERTSTTSTTATSKDHSVTVTVDGRGEISAVTFGNTKYRRMAPAELGALLVETIAAARAAAADTAIEAYQPVLPQSIGLRDIISGKMDVDTMLEEAMRAVREMSGSMPDMSSFVRDAQAMRREKEARP